MPIKPGLCSACGGGGSSTPGVDVEDLVLCDYVAGEIVGSAIAVYQYDDTTGAPVGPPTFVVPGTNTPYVVQGALKACAPPTCSTVVIETLCDVQSATVTVPFHNTLVYDCQGAFVSTSYSDIITGAPYVPTGTIGVCAQTVPTFAGFVCDVFGGSALVPAVAPTCPGSPLGAANVATTNDMTEGPAGTYTPSGTGPTITVSRTPGDDQHAICSVKFVNDAGTGDDPFWQLIGTFVDSNGNGQTLDVVWITAIEAALGVGDASDIAPGSTATASIAGTAVTITFNGPSTHSQMFGGNGAYFIRENDGDGLAAGVTLDFNPPIRAFQNFANITVPTPGSLSGFQQANATPGTAAVPAQPAGIFEVKQFRNTDGTSFYENLDGSVHAVLGTVGECGDYFQELLCDATGAQFLRVYKISGGAIASFQDYDLSGNVFAANTPVGICSETLATYRHTPTEVLCWTETTTGVVTQFLRRYLVNQDGVNVVAVLDTLLDGTTSFLASNQGTVAQCGGGAADCASTVLGTICYTPPPVSTPGTTRTSGFATAVQVGTSPGARTYTVPNWGGGTVPLVATIASSTGGLPNGDGAQVGVTAVTPNHIKLDLGEPLVNVSFRVFAFDVATNEKLTNISPPFTSVTGGTFSTVGFTEIDAVGPGITFVDVHFAGPVQVIDLDYTHTATAGIGINTVTGTRATITTTETQGTAAVVQDCTTGAVSYVDLATGLAIDISSVTIVDCGAASTAAVVTRDEELLVLCDTAPTTPAATVTGNWAGATNTGAGNAPGVWTKTNFGGSGITVTAAQDFLHGSSVAGNIDLSRTPAAAGQVVTTIDLGAVRQNIFVTLNYFGTGASEQITNIVPAADSLTGSATLGGGGTTVSPTTPDGSAVIHIPGPTQTVTLTWNSAGGLSGIGNITFDTIAVPGATSRFLRKYNYNGQTGAFIGTVDTALDGTTAHVIAGTVSQCSDATAVTPVTANAQSVLLTAGQTWTPGGSVVGTLTGVAFAVVTGTTTVTDSNGTVAAGLPPGLTGNWEVGDADALVGPQSIAAVGGNTWVTWTQK